MNFLAHFFLSFDDEPLMIGNFLGDYLRNKQVAALPEQVQKGIQLHRQIDSYTDQHPEVLKGVRRLYKRHSKYAPVIVDVFYDYLLTVNWRQYSNHPLPAFTEEIYKLLQKHLHLMPYPVRDYVPQMIADNWLETYRTHNGIAYTFRRMRRRTSKPELLERAVDSLVEQFPEFNEEFNCFFPDVIAFVEDYKRQLQLQG
jgi:acyl carrier protein phosphodiesterase